MTPQTIPDYLRLEGDMIYIDASHRRGELDKWGSVCIGGLDEIATIHEAITGKADISKIAAAYHCEADFQYWREKLRAQEKQQLKARFFGMHIGAPVQIDADMVQINAGCVFRKPNSQSKIPPMPFLNFYLPEQFGAVSMCAIDRCKLILRPLSSLTDAEAIECAKLSKELEPAKKYIVDRMVFDNGFVIHPAGAYHVRVSVYKDRLTLQQSDYLRSQHFALPFQGLDPIAENWAILETTNLK